MSNENRNLSPAMRRLQRLVYVVREFRRSPSVAHMNRLNNEIAVSEKLINDELTQRRLFDEPED